jgi:hypothetical protein
VRLLFRCRPQIRAYRRVAIVPRPFENLDADAVLTWNDIRELSEEVLGPRQLRCRLSFAEMRKKCRELGNKIQAGHAGGETDLLKHTLVDAERKQWKWRSPENKGRAMRGNWLDGARWLEIVESRHGFKG